jgi:hypothetical protein
MPTTTERRDTTATERPIVTKLRRWRLVGLCYVDMRSERARLVYTTRRDIAWQRRVPM